MKSKKFFIVFGTLFSAVLLVIVFSRLDWTSFFAALKTIRLPELFLAALVIMLNIALRSLRWTLVARMPLAQFKHFWQAANIGYLGNMIYPARAGEVLRVVAIHHFAPLVLGRAIASAVIDRMFDMIVMGIFTLLALWVHSHRIDPNIGKGVIGIFILATITLIVLILSANQLHSRVQYWVAQGKWQKRLQEWLLHALEGIQAIRQTSHLLIVLFITTSVFLLDYFWMWQIMAAFGWHLPFETALTVGVFLLLGIALPSAPGYIGIYQIACVLALGLYGIDETLAVAYSIVLQLLTFAIMGIQGMLVTIYCGFNLSREHQQELPQVS
ncbi:lysylphosphatidylglycerol synthase transmembrane domain-containing protein [Candidatus Parabeggiatoa sp. HSG14]|uniref:lysylphosphatidylglycerol synthase transmembrane domain-containing protein n=1 Tax=Candidatus Parabeggiatoa sp. HSG14 TaxID=3055593 RepID=UPI0025A7A391|nr:lysylphosphatidylglycerol synthase transmembrane domain-containing protein [Thiotrichales bacterium HSG14]